MNQLIEKNIKKQIQELPQTPGVYIFKNSTKKVIYVGKAKRLKNRVASYFQKNLKIGTKTQALITRVCDIETINTESELEALILEAELIKKYRPKYNIALKDDKSYLYIVIRYDRMNIDSKLVNIPKVLTARKTDLLPKDVTYGPYPNGSTAKYIVKTIRKVFPYRDCSKAKFVRYMKLKKPCLYGCIDLCPAPCINMNELKSYKAEISKTKRFLSGNSSKLVKEFEKRMIKASEQQNYEQAAYFRDILQKFAYIRKSFNSAEKYIENPNLLEDIAQEALLQLVENISIVDSANRIECYDISNISGKEAVGSMVVALNGTIQTSEYRKFRIKLKDTPDDFGMMQEVLKRRLKRVLDLSADKVKWGMPDIIVLDGGKGQVSAVQAIANELNVNIPIVGIAKKTESLVYYQNYSADSSAKPNFVVKNLPVDNEGLKLLIRLRDEAHRFAQKYHHDLRLRQIRV